MFNSIFVKILTDSNFNFCQTIFMVTSVQIIKYLKALFKPHVGKSKYKSLEIC